MKKPYPVAYVEWVDSAGLSSGWTRRKAVVKRGRRIVRDLYRSAGFIVDDGPDGVTMALSQDPTNGNLSEVFVIPRSAIRKVTLWTGKP